MFNCIVYLNMFDLVYFFQLYKLLEYKILYIFRQIDKGDEENNNDCFIKYYNGEFINFFVKYYLNY